MDGLQHTSPQRRCAWLALLGLAAACSDPPPPRKPAPRVVHVRSFTDAAQVRDVAVVGGEAFIATDAGLERWPLGGGERAAIGAEEGLEAGDVFAVEHEPGGPLWVATDAGLYRYDAGAGTAAALAPPPEILGVGALEDAVLEDAGDGGVWLGLATGLFYASPDDGWTNTGVTDPVRAIHRGDGGSLWIGTEQRLLVTGKGGVAQVLGADDGCDLVGVRLIAPLPGGRGQVLAVGDSPSGQPRVARASADGCVTYRVSPSDRWDALLRHGDDLLVLAGRRLYALSRGSGPRRLARDALRLVPAPGARRDAGAIDLERLDVHVPPGTEAIASAEGEILLGTRGLGTLRVALDRRARPQWLRSGDLAAGAALLTVACADEGDCFVATGTRRLWHFDGSGFRDVGDPAARALAVARSPDGQIYLLRAADGEAGVRVAVRRGDAFEDVPALFIEAPGTEPQLSFARFAPGGVLWLGLQYRDELGSLRPHGVALVDVSLGVVVYHHASADERDQAKGILPIPIGVVAAAFLGIEETWLATTQGAARVVGTHVEVFSEADGLRGEILRGVACSAGGVVYVAAKVGVGAFDGERWYYPGELRFEVNDLAIGKGGRLWMATERGLAAFDGARVRRLDARRGLVESQIREVEADHFGRIWLLGRQGIALVTP